MSQEQEIRGAQPPGKVIGGRFTVEGVLGRGGFAITYLCRSGEYNKAFAVKEFLPKFSCCSRIRWECVPNICC